MQKIKNPVLSSKQRILEASAELIAKEGYSAVGIRKIAEKAGVNLSMISYYFGGKIGILKSIMEDYNREMIAIMLDTREKNLKIEESARYFISSVVSLLKRKTNICKVAMLEIPLEVPEIASFKLKLINENMKLTQDSMKEFFSANDKAEHIIIGPLFMSMIYSHFLFVEPSRNALGMKFDDRFYEKYVDIISNFALFGLTGYKKNNKK